VNSKISNGKIETHLVDKKRLRVSSEYGIHVGHLDRYVGEMSATLVALYDRAAYQEIADRVAAAYGRISTLNMPEDYPVVTASISIRKIRKQFVSSRTRQRSGAPITNLNSKNQVGQSSNAFLS
jgi:hypothetical protein